jgi:hypothetical protein
MLANKLLCVATALGCVTLGSCMNDSVRREPAFPLVQIFVNGDSYPPPGPVHIARGLLFAVCEDGRALSATSEEEPGSDFVEGKLSPQSLKRFRKILTASEISALREECQTHLIDGGTANITIRRGKSPETYNCDWPPRGRVSDLLHQAFVAVEIYGAMPAVNHVGTLCD